MTPDDQTVMQGIWDDEGCDMDAEAGRDRERYNDAFAKAVADGKLKREDFVIPDFDALTWKPK